MNIKLVIKTLGKILLLEAIFMVLPLIVGMVYKENIVNLLAFGITILILSLIGFGTLFIKDAANSFGVKDGFAIVTFSWILMSIFGSLPFVISHQIPDFVDAIFETASGFSTTGASILTNVESLSHSMIFWRSFTHFIGGMGILVFALAVLPKSKGAVNVMRAEVPGPIFGKLVSRIDITAKILYKIYVAITVILIIILIIAGMSPFDAMIHGFGTAGTGGFSNKALSIGYYNSPIIEYILAIGMVIFGINFNLYYFILLGRLKEFFKSSELKIYILIWILSIILIYFNMSNLPYNFSDLIRGIVFSTASIMTTTGYSTMDFSKWPMFSQYIILILMLIGGCAGSTAGGLKVSRVMTVVKASINSLRRSINPKRVVTISDNGKVVNDDIIKEVLIYFMLYVAIFMAMLAIVFLDCEDFTTAFSSVLATLNNIGPGISRVGPSGNFAFFNHFSKLGFILAMIIGRLEIIPVLVLFMPSTWSKR